MTKKQRFRNVAIATAVVGALSAATALGVAPLDSGDLPLQSTVVESVPLSLRVPDSLDRFIQTETIRRGDTLSSLMSRLGANDEQFLRFVAADRVARKALQLRAGRTVQAVVDSVGRVRSFTYRTGSLDDIADAGPGRTPTRIRIARTGDTLAATEEAIPVDRNTEVRSAVVQSSLLAATDAAGIPERIAFKVADIFAGDLDMRRELRKGARLRVVYETLREADSFDAPVAGRVMAVELVNGGQHLDAIWFKDGKGSGQYFTPDGKSMRKAILRNPIEFTRITSGFTDARVHPIFHDTRAHKGVDFAAPIGTRVRATGDATVEFVGQQRGYGNMIILRHRGGRIETVYAHLQRFADGIRKGVAVTQGEVIGRVGMTGWTTGPHLHYELRVNQTQVNPLTFAVTETGRVDPRDRARFAAAIAAAEDQFAQADTVAVAARFE